MAADIYIKKIRLDIKEEEENHCMAVFLSYREEQLTGNKRGLVTESRFRATGMSLSRLSRYRESNPEGASLRKSIVAQTSKVRR